MGSWGMGTPVEIEFAVNMSVPRNQPKEFGVLQMRPLVVSQDVDNLSFEYLKESDLICKSTEVLGNGTINDIYDIIAVDINKFERAKSNEVASEIGHYNGKLITVELENMKNPTIFTNDLFKKAKKLKQKAFNITIEESNLKDKLDFLKKLRINLQNASSIDECEFLSPKKEKNQIKTKKAQNCESFFFEGFKIMLGANERENIYLLENSKASDFWFHLKDRPSCHVIVQNSKKDLPQNIIEKAASLCAKFSVDFGGTYEVDFTQRRNVKIQHGANVLYNPYSTIVVKV